MSWNHRPFSWAANSILVFLLLSSPATGAGCPIRLADVVGADTVAALKAHYAPVAASVYKSASQKPTPREVEATARETIPAVVHRLWRHPLGRLPVVTADAYAGADYASTSPNIFVLPGGERSVCHLLPGVGVFLGDGATFHYALIAEVDYQARTVTLFDPWARVSFLRKGFNQAGVAATVVEGQGGLAQLRLSFTDFATVFKGQVDATASVAGLPASVTFDTIARIYPELADTESFLFWRYTRELSGLNTRHGMDALLALAQRSDLDAKPRLAQLVDFGGLVVIVRTNFGLFWNPRRNQFISVQDEPDSPRRRAFLGRVRKEVLSALPVLTKGLPDVLLYRLLDDAADTDDLELQLAVCDSVLAEHPDDIDVGIAKAEVLLKLQRKAKADTLLAAIEQLWLRSVQSAIDVPPAQALAWFETNGGAIGLASFDVLHWQRARLTLLRAVASPAHRNGDEVAHLLKGIDTTYAPAGSFSVTYDYLADSLWLAWLSGDHALEQFYVSQGLKAGADTARWAPTMAKAILEHARWRHSIRDLLSDAWDRARSSFLKTHICDLIAVGPTFSTQTDAAFVARRNDLADFCR
jgi:hypothetical protein